MMLAPMPKDWKPASSSADWRLSRSPGPSYSYIHGQLGMFQRAPPRHCQSRPLHQRWSWKMRATRSVSLTICASSARPSPGSASRKSEHSASSIWSESGRHCEMLLLWRRSRPTSMPSVGCRNCQFLPCCRRRRWHKALEECSGRRRRGCAALCVHALAHAFTLAHACSACTHTAQRDVRTHAL